MKVFLRDGPFTTDVGIVNLQPLKGPHWVAYIKQNYFDSYGWSTPQKPSRFIIKQRGHCLYSEYRIQRQRLDCFLQHIVYMFST